MTNFQLNQGGSWKGGKCHPSEVGSKVGVELGQYKSPAWYATPSTRSSDERQVRFMG